MHCSTSSALKLEYINESALRNIYNDYIVLLYLTFIIVVSNIYV